jgi:hypothetical protein
MQKLYSNNRTQNEASPRSLFGDYLYPTFYRPLITTLHHRYRLNKESRQATHTNRLGNAKFVYMITSFATSYTLH